MPLDLILEPDLNIVNGDAQLQDNTDSSSLYIAWAQKGQLRSMPLLGVGLINYINSPQVTGRELARAIRQEHKRAGYKITELQTVNNDGEQELSIKAVKTRSVL